MKCHTLARLTRDPEVIQTQGGTCLCKFSMAENYYIGTGDERKEYTNFFDFEAWSKQAEIIAQYVKKGGQLYVESEAKQDTWEDKESGQKRSKVVFVVRDFKLVGSRQSSQSETAEDNTPKEEKTKPAKAKPKEQPKVDEEAPF